MVCARAGGGAGKPFDPLLHAPVLPNVDDAEVDLPELCVTIYTFLDDHQRVVVQRHNAIRARARACMHARMHSSMIA